MRVWQQMQKRQQTCTILTIAQGICTYLVQTVTPCTQRIYSQDLLDTNTSKRSRSYATIASTDANTEFFCSINMIPYYERSSLHSQPSHGFTQAPAYSVGHYGSYLPLGRDISYTNSFTLQMPHVEVFQ